MTSNAPVIDWDHIATLSGAALESALAAVTDVRCEPDARYSHTVPTGASRTEHVVSAETLHALAGAAPVAAPHTLRDAVADALAAVRAACPDVTTALTLSAVLHGDDVVSASGRVVGTRLARALTGADDADTVGAVRDALALALAAVAAPLADVLADDDAPADVRTVAHTHAGRVIRRGTVTVSTGGHRERDGLTTTTRARHRAIRAAWLATTDVRRIGRKRYELADVNGYPYALGYSPVSILAGPVPCPPAARPVPHTVPGLYRSAVATAMTRGLTSGQGIGADGTRDALRRVSLSVGHTVSPERLAGPAVGGSYVNAAPNGTGRARKPRPAARVQADAARDALAALRARMGV